MIALTKNDINIFGEKSVAFVKPYKNSYAIIRKYDNAILCIDDKFYRYMDDIIRTMYIGETRGSGDIVLVSDLHNIIHTFI